MVFFLNLFFVGTRKDPPVNQWIISSIGEASFLNPILAQDSASRGSGKGKLIDLSMAEEQESRM